MNSACRVRCKTGLDPRCSSQGNPARPDAGCEVQRAVPETIIRTPHDQVKAQSITRDGRNISCTAARGGWVPCLRPDPIDEGFMPDSPRCSLNNNIEPVETGRSSQGRGR